MRLELNNRANNDAIPKVTVKTSNQPRDLDTLLNDVAMA